MCVCCQAMGVWQSEVSAFNGSTKALASHFSSCAILFVIERGHSFLLPGSLGGIGLSDSKPSHVRSAKAIYNSPVTNIRAPHFPGRALFWGGHAAATCHPKHQLQQGLGWQLRSRSKEEGMSSLSAGLQWLLS